MSDRLTSVMRHVGLADVRPDATLRLDAVARIVQDAADADFASADVPGMGTWILRRLALDISHTPRFRADVEARTWCSGVGPRWAERRTDLHVGACECVAATAIWVHVDSELGTPAPLPAGFNGVWGGGSDSRRVRATLTHLRPPDHATASRWPLRSTDFDVMGHVNNAAYWASVEDELTRRGRPKVLHAEIEFRAGLLPGDDVTFLVAERPDGFAAWCAVRGDVRASMLVRLRP